MTSDDALAAEALRAHGISVISQPWDIPSHGQYPSVLRSCWNYHRKPAEFLAFIAEQETSGSLLWNHPETIRWNLDKFYLRDLMNRGCPIIPTVFVPRFGTADLKKTLDENRWSAAVVKPSISATSYRTWIALESTAASQQQDLDALLADHGVLIQQFMPEIQATGELSLVFFNGRFTHAMHKTAAAGDFRVQEEHGGCTVGTQVPDTIVHQADRALRLTPGAPHLYARVDGIVSGTMFFIMEIELIEPSLYLATSVDAPARFAKAIAERMNP
jgi:glutathione synthase/RimK-type ligase-like ATP-grasp enzyme